MIKSNPEADLDELMAELDVNERRYVFARAMSSNDKDAYTEIGVSYNWLNAHDKDKLNFIAAELVRDVGFQMMQLIKQHGVEAVNEKIEQMRNRDVRIRSQATTEIIDRIIGKPTQRVDQTTEQSGRITIEYVNDWRNPTPEST